MSHEEFLDGLEKGEEYIEPKWKKPLIMILGVFLVFLILGYYLVVSDALIGIINSKTVQDSVLQAKGVKIIFQNSTLELLQQEYLKNQKREIKACLSGKVENNEYIINSISFPKVLSASVAHIQTPGCHEAIIDLHSHPINRCVPSNQDLRNFGRNKRTNPELIMMVMCWKNRFSVTV